VLKHLVGLFKNRPGARQWRRAITESIQRHPGTIDLPGLYRAVFD
jgi:hypothetical protein